ncbi:MAG TPA: 4Fe-4S dicluster domain-containing protein [Nitrospirales bacterium]|nr:4Fe-4S dicluster domain-containing protein [Nitrospirales bacterium]
MTLNVRIQRPARLDMPFSHETSEEDVDRVLTFPPFSHMDPAKFPSHAPLREILLNDTRILRYRAGDIMVREGDYGNSAYFIMSGSVQVFLNLPKSILGRKEPRRKGLFNAIAQLWRNPTQPEERTLSPDTGVSRVKTRYDKAGNAHVFLQDLPVILGEYETNRIEVGDLFGEISALGRVARTATIVADQETELLEIRWQGLRRLRLFDQRLKEDIDARYRERNLKVHLLQTPLFQHLTLEQLEEVANQVEFQSYGDFDWYGPYKAIMSRSAAERLDHEPIIAEEGHYPNGLILIRSGFVRLSQQFGHGHRTLTYLGRGKIYGLEEIEHNWQSEARISLKHTLRAIGYVDILLVPTHVIESLVLPSLPSAQLRPLVPSNTRHVPVQRDREHERRIDPDFLEFLVDERFINGTSTMMINLDRCTGCDDCVRACATAHENNPRFTRHGKRDGKYLIANACMHCVDPVCLIGCPTGAIHREGFHGHVVIDDTTCVGCSTCANSCPYDNIQMVDIRDENGHLILDERTHAPILKATKCDLCVDQLGGPACQRACPHDALQRIDMSDLFSLSNGPN